MPLLFNDEKKKNKGPYFIELNKSLAFKYRSTNDIIMFLDDYYHYEWKTSTRNIKFLEKKKKTAEENFWKSYATRREPLEYRSFCALRSGKKKKERQYPSYPNSWMPVDHRIYSSSNNTTVVLIFTYVK